MRKDDLIKYYEELKYKLEVKIETSSEIKHTDSYKKGVTILEVFTFVLKDLENLNAEDLNRDEKLFCNFIPRCPYQCDFGNKCLSKNPCSWKQK